ncbi:MAG TPA: hypothetical protein DC047_15035 [Blastocatellia bacterium]|nr:hypothetical protein [Blastocatellia bacterium]
MTFVLSVSVLAGDIPCGAPAPAPEGSTQTTITTSPGEIPCGFAEQISEAGLSGLLVVLGLVI